MALENPTFDTPVASCSLGGRIFYGVGSLIYYSVVQTDIKASGICYQVNDPTSEDNPDLLSTDGGRIELDEASGVFKLVPYRGGVLIFAKNGVWFIWGPEEGFSADNYTVTKVTERVLSSALSVVQAESDIYFMTNSGIQRITTSELNFPITEDVTEMTIRGWYLDNLEGKSCTGEYRPREKQIWWTSTVDEVILVHDLRVPAFYPQRNAGGRQVQRGLASNNTFRFVNYESNGDTLSYSFAEDTSEDFKDFGEDQVSYLISAYETLGKFSHKQSITEADVYFNKTETQILGVTGVNQDYIYDKPSSCLFQARWDFDNSNSFRKWTGRTTNESGSGKRNQLYNPLTRGFIPTDFPWDFDTGESVIHKKFKVRGNGKAVQFRFEAQPEKDMQLLGYSVAFTMRSKM